VFDYLCDALAVQTTSYVLHLTHLWCVRINVNCMQCILMDNVACDCSNCIARRQVSQWMPLSSWTILPRIDIVISHHVRLWDCFISEVVENSLHCNCIHSIQAKKHVCFPCYCCILRTLITFFSGWGNFENRYWATRLAYILLLQYLGETHL